MPINSGAFLFLSLSLSPRHRYLIVLLSWACVRILRGGSEFPGILAEGKRLKREVTCLVRAFPNGGGSVVGPRDEIGFTGHTIESLHSFTNAQLLSRRGVCRHDCFIFLRFNSFGFNRTE